MIRNSLRALALMALAAGVALGSLPAVAQTRKIVLGYELPLSGDSSHYGEVFRNAADLMLEDFKSSGGCPAPTSSSATKTARTMRARHATSPRCSSTTNPWLACWATFPAPSRWQSVKSMPRPACPSCHRQPPPRLHQDQQMAVSQRHDAGLRGPLQRRLDARARSCQGRCRRDPERLGPLGGREFRQRLRGEGRRRHLDGDFNPGVRDFRSILTKINRAAPDGIYLCMFYEEGASFLEQRQQLRVAAPVFAASSLYNEQLLQLAGSAVDGLMLSSTFVPTNPDPRVQSFVTRYTEKYGE